jgi:hypothetical protein
VCGNVDIDLEATNEERFKKKLENEQGRARRRLEKANLPPTSMPLNRIQTPGITFGDPESNANYQAQTEIDCDKSARTFTDS